MASRTPPNPHEIAIVTVHGTGDTVKEKTVDGDKWFQNGSVFTGRLKERLAKQGIQATIVPHFWSGENSAKDRERGARDLRKAVNEHAKQFGGVHVIGHSHGGNVADEAAAMLDWRLHKKRPQKLSSVTTVGTPFFKNQVGTWQAFGGMAFLVVMLLSIVGLAITMLIIRLLIPEYQHQIEEAMTQIAALQHATGDNGAQISKLQQDVEEGKQFVSFFQPMSLIAIASGLALFLVLPIAIQGSGRVRRGLRKQNTGAPFFSIWHPNDEAIAFLQRVEELPIEPFPRWTLWRASRTSGVVWGVGAVIAAFLLAIAVSVGGTIGAVHLDNGSYKTLGDTFHFDGVALFGDMKTLEFGIFLLITTILGAPLFFGAAYALTRLLRGLAFEMVGRGWLNTSIAGIVRGMAFGRDGDERIGKVATQSHAYGVRPYMIDGDLAARMKTGAATAAATLIEKYRWSLFTVGPDTNNSVTQIAKDAMTWDSLIHTTYFDQPEVADMIGDYIAECVERDRDASK